MELGRGPPVSVLADESRSGADRDHDSDRYWYPVPKFSNNPDLVFFYGFKGSDVAIASRPFLGEVQFVALQNAWRNWALSINFGIYALIVLFIIFAAVFSANTPATKDG